MPSATPDVAPGRRPSFPVAAAQRSTASAEVPPLEQISVNAPHKAACMLHPPPFAAAAAAAHSRCSGVLARPWLCRWPSRLSVGTSRPRSLAAAPCGVHPPCAGLGITSGDEAASRCPCRGSCRLAIT
eukprot:scaffold97448_cov21-Tisochrysis_lutea.AAC.1